MQNFKIEQLFSQLWQSYLEVTPSALKVHELLGAAQNRDIKKHHIAFRTVNDDRVKLEKLAQHFLTLGYLECGDYMFEKKHLRAKHFEHPSGRFPKVFISEIQVEKLSDTAQAIIEIALADLSGDTADTSEFLWSGKHWNVFYPQYNQLLKESEYLAWLYLWGFRANHFTVDVNALEQFDSIEEVNSVLKANGFLLNINGGEVKGSQEQMLKQSSILADMVDFNFVDQQVQVPSCFYEFAERYEEKEGKLFGGFIASSADKTFESTNTR